MIIFCKTKRKTDKRGFSKQKEWCDFIYKGTQMLIFFRKYVIIGKKGWC